ncbi:hypothetical protein GGR65_000618 [Xanthomonas sp. 3376]|nr:hypothetical protein [Xanthomonas arboricola]
MLEVPAPEFARLAVASAVAFVDSVTETYRERMQTRSAKSEVDG